MDTTLPLPFLPRIDLEHLPTESSEGLTEKQLSYLGCAYFTLTKETLDTLLEFLRKNASIEAFIDVRNIESIQDIVTIIDAGARKVFVTPTQREALKDYENRLVPVQASVEPLCLDTHKNGILLDIIDDASSPDLNLRVLSMGKVSPVYLITSTASLNAYVALAKEYSAIPVIQASSLTVGPGIQGKVSIPTFIGAVWYSDREDKLIPTVVTDERGFALGLVYSSQESLAESLKTGTGVYQSRKRGLWYKGATSGDTQELIRISLDCDLDSLRFVVRQKGRGFCHLPQPTCFGELRGLSRLESTLVSRKDSAPQGSYTARLFSDAKLLRAKIMEEAEELCNATTKDEVAFESADLMYFALTKAVSAGVSLADIEQNLDAKSVKVRRRKGDAKGPWAAKEGITDASQYKVQGARKKEKEMASVDKEGSIKMRRYYAATASSEDIKAALQRPSQRSTETIMGIVHPIIQAVRHGGDQAVLSYTHKFEKATLLTSPVLKAPYPPSLMKLPPETISAIDVSYENIRKFHAAQKEGWPLQVETMPGITCSRFVRPIERVGLYVPGGTAVLPSTALMLGVPAMVAGCKTIVIATPPREDGSVSPEIIYIADKIGAESIVLAGGAQAVAAMAYGTESISKVDKILGPGNQFVTAAKMYVSNDTNAGVSIDMPAGPSEVLVIADKEAHPAFVASDLLSQAEHGVDSQVILIAIDLSEEQLATIETELHTQAMALPRVDMVRGAIAHSVTLVVRNVQDALKLSNAYAPEHLILQVRDAGTVVDLVENAGSVFIGPWTPESVGDYSAGVNHSLPTYGYAKQYSGVNLASFTKHITSSQLTPSGLRNIGNAVMQLAHVEGLEGHRRAVKLRLEYLDGLKLSS